MADPVPLDTPPVDRFSDRANEYATSRPDYPAALGELIVRYGGLISGPDGAPTRGVPTVADRSSPVADRGARTVADIGSGTGISSRLLLDAGCRVIGVEPNAAMRAVSVAELANEPRFTAVAGTAEATTLPDASVDMVVAGQAFHWFDPVPARDEFQRILRPGGAVALFWNIRSTSGTPLLNDYEALLQEFGGDYHATDTRHEQAWKNVSVILGPDHRFETFPHAQHLDRAGLRARVESSSYMPLAGSERYPAMVSAIDAIFDRHQVDGVVTIPYTTRVYLGRAELRGG